MNWKLIWKYVGLIIAATFLVGFFFGLIGNFYIKTGEQNPIPFVIMTALANLAATAIIFAKLSLEQRERTIVHALAVLLFCWLISLPLNVGLLGQPLAQWASTIIVLIPTTAVGVAAGVFLRRPKKYSYVPAAFAPRVEVSATPNGVEIKDSGIRINAEAIWTCMRCAAKNRVRKAVMLGVQPVCGKCAGKLEEAFYSPKMDDSEYVDVDSVASQYRFGETYFDNYQPLKSSEATGRQIVPPYTLPLQPNSPAPQIEDEPASDELKDRLFGLLYGDKEKAFRIVNALKRKHSERSEKWCWEKAVEDLIHDR